MNTAIMTWIKIGALSLSFILIGKMLFVGRIPVVGDLFAAA